MLSSDASQCLIVNNDPGSIQASVCNYNSDNQIVVKINPQLFQCSYGNCIPNSTVAKTVICVSIIC